MKRVRIFYSNLKIHQKLFFQQFVLVLIFAAVSLAGIQAALRLYDAILYRESAKALNMSTTYIENELKSIEKASMDLLANPIIQKGLRQLQQPLSDTERFRIGNQLTDILWNSVFERNLLSVHLIDLQGYQYAGGSALSPRWRKTIREQAAAGEGAAVFIRPLPGVEGWLCARQIREIRNLSLRELGTVIIRINAGGLVRRSTLAGFNFKGQLLIYDGSRQMFGAGPLAEALKKRVAIRDDNGYLVEQLGGNRYFVTYTHSERGWTYINILPYDLIFGSIVTIRSVIIGVFGLLLAGAVFFSLKTARDLTKPIELLSERMKRVENGEFTLDEAEFPEAERGDEIGQLHRDFIIMIRKINTLIQEDYTKQLVLKDTQLRALQAQINPHFLYNTMESINWLAKLGGQQQISRMVEALGNLMRSAISNRESLITVGRELGLLNDYIAIQQMRFGERLQFELAVDPQWQDLMIPKLTLQPIVENSIRYGLETVTGICRIRVWAEENGGDLSIGVEDNGPGIAPEVMGKWERGESQSGSSGIGLKNIHDRLRLQFGEGYGITIAGRPGGGTLVRIKIPGREQADDTSIAGG